MKRQTWKRLHRASKYANSFQSCFLQTLYLANLLCQSLPVALSGRMTSIELIVQRPCRPACHSCDIVTDVDHEYMQLTLTHCDKQTASRIHLQLMFTLIGLIYVDRLE